MNNSERKINVCAVIPFYNEKETIKSVIECSLKYVNCVIAVDDCSNDYSEKNVPVQKNVVLLQNEKNYGKGYSLQKGFAEAVKLNYDFVITIDADLQHDPDLIPKFIAEYGKADILIGNRMNNTSKMPMQRIASNRLTSFLLSKKLATEIKDSQCGYRAYSIDVLKKIKTQFTGFEAESEILVKAIRAGFKINFIDISTIYENEKSKMRPLQAIAGFIKVLFL